MPICDNGIHVLTDVVKNIVQKQVNNKKSTHFLETLQLHESLNDTTLIPVLTLNISENNTSLDKQYIDIHKLLLLHKFYIMTKDLKTDNKWTGDLTKTHLLEMYNYYGFSDIYYELENADIVDFEEIIKRNLILESNKVYFERKIKKIRE